jgi:hypothetical protein
LNNGSEYDLGFKGSMNSRTFSELFSHMRFKVMLLELKAANGTFFYRTWCGCYGLLLGVDALKVLPSDE